MEVYKDSYVSVDEDGQILRVYTNGHLVYMGFLRDKHVYEMEDVDGYRAAQTSD